MTETVMSEVPPAVVAGQPLVDLPDDLYVPPDALRVFLETFEGPLDLLLYLIRRQNLDIVAISIDAVASQYIAYIEMMDDMAIELAGEYLLMAAMLAEIKSRSLLPRPPPTDEEDAEQDPRVALIERLREYEQFKHAAENLDALPRTGRDVAVVRKQPEILNVPTPQPEADLARMLGALADVARRTAALREHHVQRETLSVRAHMSSVLSHVSASGRTPFSALIDVDHGRPGVVVLFLAVLELLRDQAVQISADDSDWIVDARGSGKRSEASA
ncbi:segregation/condensation protein A [Salinisphaera sp. USBA-960]|uniref:segregation and condensation protein A n=1 Tax=Salinisphaera orenii TaxID=856731 RepID=UPI000DBE1C6E|nr:segregation/condensation protein A [Salifodinibacter halophilus]NNC25643.1 segregation/condensation protein A [Salifodinibacter halophilus]